MRGMARIVLAAVLTGAALVSGAASEAGAGTGPPNPVTVTLPGTFRDMVVHPTTGQVFVAAGDAVSVYSPTGALVDRVEDQFQASGLALNGNDLYVSLAGSGAIARISTTTRDVTGAWTIGRTIFDTIAFGSGRVWFSHGTHPYGDVGSLDPATGAITLGAITSNYWPLLRTSAARPGELYVAERGVSPANVERWNIAVSPPVRLAGTGFGDIGSNLRDFRLSPDGSRITVATGFPYNYPEVNPVDLIPTGVVYEGTNYPLAAAYSADGAVHVGGSDATHGFDVWVHATGIPTSVTQIELGFNLAPRGLGLSPDGSVLYAASASATNALRIQPLDMRIDSVTPSPVVLGEAETFRLDGARFQIARGATVGGIEAVVIPNPGGTQLTVYVPDGVSPGTHEVVVRSRISTVSTMVTFVAPCDGRTPTILGTAGDDTLVGTAGDDVIVGLRGNDTISGRGGNDVVCGGPGNDTITASAGNDLVLGGDGVDTIDGGVGSDGINGGPGADQIRGAADLDIILAGPGGDHVDGGPGNDVVVGEDGDDVIVGLDGNDYVDAGSGNDQVSGSQGDDTLKGGPGNDTVRGQTGVDSCDGGADTDTDSGCETKVGFP
jgi:hypothetical protein